MPRDLTRLLQPRSIAVVGGGAWCRSVIEQCDKIGFAGPIWPVHPTRPEIAGHPALPDLASLPEAPDAVFLGINRSATIEAVATLNAMGAGGAVCFASGFSESAAELADGHDMQRALITAAGDMPILGPNCYGFINYLDGALLWPDQHGGQRVESGVAILTQSSNIAINLTMQRRALPIAYMVTVGNQAQTGLSEIGRALLADERVTALGLHIEGIGDLRAFEALAADAAAHGKPIVVLKSGRSARAQAAAISHTASLSGSDAGAQALFERLGMARAGDLPEFLETLKLLHFAPPLTSNRVVSISCSGGEASLVADAALDLDLAFPPLQADQLSRLRAALGPLVALSNPLDYHTFIWNDVPAMTAVFRAAMAGDVALAMVIVDFPRSDRCDPQAWDCVIEAAAAAVLQSGTPMALVSSLPENLDEETSARIIASGLIPLHGIETALGAVSLAAHLARPIPAPAPILTPRAPGAPPRVLDEARAKTVLADHGLCVPRARVATTPQETAEVADALGFPVVLKGLGRAHKTEAGLVALGLRDVSAVQAAAEKMACETYLVEEMIEGGIAELLIGVLRDPAHGYVLTLAAGGVQSELLGDRVSLLIPAPATQIAAALDRLRMAPLLKGYRGAAAADKQAIVSAVLAVQDFVIAHADRLQEVEINPLICCVDRAVAVDALIREGEASDG